MKITDVRTTLLTGPSTNDPFFLRMPQAPQRRVHRGPTPTGSTGIGETYAGYFCPEVVPAIVEFFKPILIGQTVDDIPELWRRMYHCGNFWCRVGLGAIVLNGIEAALWDLKGKLLGQPVLRSCSAAASTTGCRATPRAGRATTRRSGWRRRSTIYLASASAAIKVGAG